MLILCPTRELAVQVCEEVHRLGAKMRGLHATPVYGGAPMDRQLRALRDGVHLIVGTPGRLLDHLRRGSFDASHIRMAILDEADRMLDMGFKDEMDELLAALPAERQTLVFLRHDEPGRLAPDPAASAKTRKSSKSNRKPAPFPPSSNRISKSASARRSRCSRASST